MKQPSSASSIRSALSDIAVRLQQVADSLLGRPDPIVQAAKAARAASPALVQSVPSQSAAHAPKVHRRLSDAERAQAIYMLEQNWPVASIAKQMDVSRAAIYFIRDAANLQVRRRTTHA